MDPKSFELLPFQKSEKVEPFGISGAFESNESGVRLEFSLSGPLDKLVISSTSEPPQKIAGLWEFTCFEAFMSAPKSLRYIEWNFSPSHDFDLLFFESYRKLVETKLSSIPKISVSKTRHKLDLRAEFEFEHLARFLENPSSLEMGICAVLEHRDQSKSYWALAHSGVKPDFHLRSDFRATMQTP